MKPIETTFKRIETKYVVYKKILDKLVQDLKSLSKTFVKFNLIETKLKKTFRKSLGFF